MLLTIDEYKEFAGIETAAQFPSKRETEVTALIAAAETFIEEYCNRKFTEYVSTDFVQWNNGDANQIYLEKWPVLSITSVETSSDGGLTLTELVADEDYIYLDDQESIVTVSGRIFSSPPAWRAVKITYRYGYDIIPADLKHATYLLVKYYEDHEYTPKKDFQGEQVQNTGFTILDKDLPGHIKRILDMYRDITVW